MAGNFQNMMRYMNLQIQEAQYNLRNIKPKDTQNKTYYIKISKIQTQREIWKQQVRSNLWHTRCPQ